jgi:hypothetical protein
VNAGFCFTPCDQQDKILSMSTITAILEADADGTLHLPVPAELRQGRVEVTATLRAVDAVSGPAIQSAPDRVARRKAALAELRGLGGLRDVIPDPVEWQREMRRDRSLPDRD